MALRFRLDGNGLLRRGAGGRVTAGRCCSTLGSRHGAWPPWADVEACPRDVGRRQDEAEKHPDALLMLGVTIWATRRIAGDG